MKPSTRFSSQLFAGTARTRGFAAPALAGCAFIAEYLGCVRYRTTRQSGRQEMTAPDLRASYNRCKESESDDGSRNHRWVVIPVTVTTRTLRVALATSSRSGGVIMRAAPGPALSSEQWAERDYRPSARDLDTWANQKPERRGEDDDAEYVAKVGLSYDEGVIVMNRAHDRVLGPPPARAALAAFALVEQPFGFTHEDEAIVRQAAERLGKEAMGAELRSLADRLAALLPPASV